MSGGLAQVGVHARLRASSRNLTVFSVGSFFADGAPGPGSRQVTFKVNWEGDIRRISCGSTLEELTAAACCRFGLKSFVGLVFQYVDADSDTITVDCQSELKEAISVSRFTDSISSSLNLMQSACII